MPSHRREAVDASAEIDRLETQVQTFADIRELLDSYQGDPRKKVYASDVSKAETIDIIGRTQEMREAIEAVRLIVESFFAEGYLMTTGIQELEVRISQLFQLPSQEISRVAASFFNAITLSNGQRGLQIHLKPPAEVLEDRVERVLKKHRVQPKLVNHLITDTHEQLAALLDRLVRKYRGEVEIALHFARQYQKRRKVSFGYGRRREEPDPDSLVMKIS